MLYGQVNGWTIKQYAQSESSAKPSCAAVRFEDRLTALRIEHFEEGYLYGVNGLSRKTHGLDYSLSFWFDNDRDAELSGMAAAYVRGVV